MVNGGSIMRSFVVAPIKLSGPKRVQICRKSTLNVYISNDLRQTLVSLTLARGEVPVAPALRLFLPESWMSKRSRVSRTSDWRDEIRSCWSPLLAR